MTAASSGPAMPAPRVGIRRHLKKLVVVAACAGALAFVLLPIGRPATRATVDARVAVAPTKPACSERPREILIDGRRVEAYEVVCGDGATTVAALPAAEVEPPIWSTPTIETSGDDPPVEEPSASIEQRSERPPAAASRAKPKPRPAAHTPPPRRNVAAASPVSQEKYGP